jgi:hypothetical protein
MHRTLKQEATIPPAGSLRGQQREFDRFRGGIQPGAAPRSAGDEAAGGGLSGFGRGDAETDRAVRLPGHYLVRRVSRAGTIRVFKKQVFVSNTLHEDQVGLEEVDDGVYDLFFCFYQIGRYELRTNRIHDIVTKVGLSRRQIE